MRERLKRLWAWFTESAEDYRKRLARLNCERRGWHRFFELRSDGVYRMLQFCRDCEQEYALTPVVALSREPAMRRPLSHCSRCNAIGLFAGNICPTCENRIAGHA